VRRIFSLALVIIMAGGSVAWANSAWADPTETLTLPGAPTSALDRTPVQLQMDIYRPAQSPAPAVVLAHGFGGSKDAVAQEAQFLVERGFVVVAYSARGFGGSTGAISMNAPEFEVADASKIIDYLGDQTYVTQEVAGDPMVGFAGGSYGGALALMIAGYDSRVDAISADITWNDLEAALFAQSTLPAKTTGVFKELWSGLFFSAGLQTTDGQVTTCGRFTPTWCAAYSDAAAQGILTAESQALMAASSPKSITAKITVPTLLGGGQSDSLFPLQQVNANAEQIMQANPNTPVKVIWHGQGHDGGVDESERLREISARWFDTYLAGAAPVAGAADFEVSLTQGSAFGNRDQGTIEVLTAPRYPGVFGVASSTITLGGPRQDVLAPAGGVPAALSSLPGTGGLAALAGSLLSLPLPNQTASFASAPLVDPLRIIGAPRARISVTSAERLDDVVLFASVRVIGPTGQPLLPKGIVAPIRLTDIGPTPTTVEIQLPVLVLDVSAGERLALVVGTTDQAYRLPSGPAVYSIELADTELSVPVVPLTSASPTTPLWVTPLIGLGAVVIIALAVILLRPRRGSANTRTDLMDVPIAVECLTKNFGSRVKAVDNVTFQVPRGVVLGLLGPNGAGKTTTMRMVMGLIYPASGDSFIFGQRVFPGAPAIAHIGSFIEGPGFLPHLSGRENLDLYWRGSGREHLDPHLAEILEVAGLGSAIDRKVRTYSQGMRQRLGIAQAMLGLPDVLVLDEPTNGLDPPQIREMRKVLKDYVANGKTVVISSHLLSEVEQTCSHVVVMHHGTVIANGTVAELLEGRTGQRLEDVFMEIVGEGHEVVSS
jgi:ABC-2 type transport system ATP-binding protein